VLSEDIKREYSAVRISHQIGEFGHVPMHRDTTGRHSDRELQYRRSEAADKITKVALPNFRFAGNTVRTTHWSHSPCQQARLAVW
jgi:hypothetical protein